MTLLVRDEVDIVDSHLRFHLANGVDFVIATDHRSQDGTTDVLRQYEREGRLHLIQEESAEFRQRAWVTRMARLAATDFAADWVLNSDVDEFWWPREGGLRDVLQAVPPRFGIVHGLWRHFVMRPETRDPFYERMTIRTRPVRDPASPYVAALKALHRADPEVIVGRGNHKARGHRLVPLRDWVPIEVLHFPIRTQVQLERKFRREAESLPADIGLTRHQAAAVRAFGERGVEAVASGFLVDGEELANGLAAGVLVEDVRVRDALRGTAPPPGADPPTIEDDAAIAAEVAEAIPSHFPARLGARLDRLDRRLRSVERVATPVRRHTRV